MNKRNLIWLCIMISSLLVLSGHLMVIAQTGKSTPTRIKVTGETTLTNIKPCLRDIMPSPDGKKLAAYIGEEMFLIEVTNIRNITDLMVTENIHSWSLDSQYIIKEDYDFRIKDNDYPNIPARQQIDFTVLSITTKETYKSSVRRRSLSYSEGLWYIPNQDVQGKVTMVHPIDLKKDDPLLKDGMMIPYQIVKNVGELYQEQTEEKEIWIRTRDKDFKILDKIGKVWARLSPKRNRLLLVYTETDKTNARVCVYDLATNKLYDLLSATDGGSGFNWSPDGEWLIYAKAHKAVRVILAESEEQKITTREKAYFDWGAGSHPVGDIFAVSWDAKQVIQLTKDSESGKTVSFYDPVVWFADNKVAFLYLTFQYDKKEIAEGETTLTNVIPTWGIKLGEMVFKR